MPVHQNMGKENRYRKIVFAILISTLGRFNRAKKKIAIYTLTHPVDFFLLFLLKYVSLILGFHVT